MTTRSKIQLENPMHAAGIHCLQTQPSCTLHGEIVRKQNLSARCTRTLFANPALLQTAQRLCRRAKAPCNRAAGLCLDNSIKIINISTISLKFLSL